MITITEHYFSQNPQSKSTPHRLEEEIKGQRYTFTTDAGVFSRTEIDKGTKILLSALELNPGETVLDLGCGYGPIGIVAAKMVGPQGKVYMVDINERAVELAKQNATINGVDNVDIRVNDGLNGLNIDFDCIITNPPIRAGKQVIYKMVDDAYERLKAEGRLIMVIRMKQGAKSMEQKLQELFDEVHTIERKSGYRVLLAQKITSS